MNTDFIAYGLTWLEIEPESTAAETGVLCTTTQQRDHTLNFASPLLNLLLAITTVLSVKCVNF